MTHALIERLVELRSLSKALQHRVFEHAEQAGDHQVLELLAQRDDLHPEVDERFTEISAARVLRVWLRKEDRDPALVEKLARSETRKTVLEVLASKPGLTRAASQAIADRKARQADQQLVANDDVDDVVRAQAAGQLVAEYVSTAHGFVDKFTYDVIAALRKAPAAAGDVMCDAIVAHAVRQSYGGSRVLFHELVEQAAMRPLTGDRPDTLIEWISTELATLQDQSKWTTSDYQRTSSAKSLLGSLVDVCAISEVDTTTMQTAVDIADAHCVGSDFRKEAAAVRDSARELIDVTSRRDQLVVAAESDAEDRIAEALSYAASTKVESLRLRLLSEVLRNPHATVDQFETALRTSSNRSLTDLALAAAIDQRSVPKQAAVVARNNTWMPRRTMARIHEPAAVVAELLSRGDLIVRATALIEMMVRRGCADQLPASLLVSELRVVDDDLVVQLYDHLEQAAGNDDAWETTVSLLEEFDGSIGELAATAMALCPPVDVPDDVEGQSPADDPDTEAAAGAATQQLALL